MAQDYKLPSDISLLPNETDEREKALRECDDHENNKICEAHIPQNQSKLNFTSGTIDFDYSGANFVLENMIQEAELVLVYGEPKVGKSYVLMHLALCMALRIPWLGIETMPDVNGNILWIDHDMGHKKSIFRMQSVREGLKQQYGLENKDFDRFILLDKSNFSDAGLPSLDFETEDSVDELKKFIRNHHIKVCFFDHLSKIRGCTDENSSTDMTRVFTHIESLKNDTGCAFIVLHHSGKSEKAGARGSVVVYAEPDDVFALVKNDKNIEGSLRLDVGYARDLGKSQIHMSMHFIPMRYPDGRNVHDQKGRDITIFQLSGRKSEDADIAQPKNENPLTSIILKEIRQNSGISMNVFARLLLSKYPDIAKSEATVKRTLNKMLESVNPLLTSKQGKRNSKLLYSAKEKDHDVTCSEGN